MQFFFQKHDGDASARRGHSLPRQPSPPGRPSDTANEHDEGPHSLYLQAHRNVQIVLLG